MNLDPCCGAHVWCHLVHFICYLVYTYIESKTTYTYMCIISNIFVLFFGLRLCRCGHDMQQCIHYLTIQIISCVSPVASLGVRTSGDFSELRCQWARSKWRWSLSWMYMDILHSPQISMVVMDIYWCPWISSSVNRSQRIAMDHAKYQGIATVDIHGYPKAFVFFNYIEGFRWIVVSVTQQEYSCIHSKESFTQQPARTCCPGQGSMMVVAGQGLGQVALPL